MKAGEIGKRLNINPNTARGWADQYARFMSDGATARKRDFSEQDLLVLGTIQRLRAQGKPHFEIVAALDAGELIDHVPPLVPPEVEAARREIDLVPAAAAEQNKLIERVKTLESALADAIEEKNRAIERWQSDTSELNSRIQQLQLELGEARGALAERLPMRLTLQIAAVFIVGLLVFLALAVLYFGGRAG